MGETVDGGRDKAPIRPFADSPARPTGWGRIAVLALLTTMFSVVNPALLIFVPLALLLIAMPPRRGLLAIVGVVLLALTFAGRGENTIWWFARGWTLILSAWFLVAVALLPHLTVTMRALTAVGGAAVTSALLFAVNLASWENIDSTVAEQLRNGAAELQKFWAANVKNPALADEMSKGLERFTDWQIAGFPALLSLASLAGLSLAWFLWRRFTLRDPRPFGPLREFRFSDHLVWIVVAGVLMVVLPAGAALARTGANLLVFMAALYTLRGFAVMLWMFGTPTVLGAAFGAIIFLLLYPIVMATTLMVGLTDTWLDLRARRKKQDYEKP